MKNTIFVTYNKSPLWQRLLAAACYTSAFYLVFKFILNYDAATVSRNPRGLAVYLEVAAILIVVALRFSLSTSYHFDTIRRRFKKSYDIGAIGLGRWKDITKNEYISVFIRRGFHTEINLWYGDENHVTIDAYDTKEEALKEAIRIAHQLEIKLWNATDPRNGFWVNVDVG